MGPKGSPWVLSFTCAVRLVNYVSFGLPMSPASSGLVRKHLDAYELKPTEIRPKSSDPGKEMKANSSKEGKNILAHSGACDFAYAYLLRLNLL